MDNYNFEYEQKKKKKLKKGPLYVIGCLLCLVIGMGAGYFLRGSQTSVEMCIRDRMVILKRNVLRHCLEVIVRWLIWGLF